MRVTCRDVLSSSSLCEFGKFRDSVQHSRFNNNMRETRCWIFDNIQVHSVEVDIYGENKMAHITATTNTFKYGIKTSTSIRACSP